MLTTSARDVLTQSEARDRAARMSDCQYVLELDIQAGAATYRGDVRISFRDSGSGDSFLCMRGKTIESFEVNGEPVTPDWNGFRLVLPGSLLKTQNEVRIVYENDYDHQGDGFHQ